MAFHGPQDSSASPGCFIKAINEVTKCLEQVAAYLDGVIVFDSDPTAHFETMRVLFDRLRKHTLKLSPSNTGLRATDANCLSQSISPAGVPPKAETVSTLIKILMPWDLKQVCALLGGVGYHRKCLHGLSKRIRLITSLLRKGVKFEFTPAMEVIIREIFAEVAAPPGLGFPDRDAEAGGSGPLHVYYHACIDDVDAALE